MIDLQTIGQLFAFFAQDKLHLWSSMVGQRVTHSDFGSGTIVEVAQREKYIPVIKIRFASEKNSTSFNSDSFKTDRFLELGIPTIFLESFRIWRVQWEKERALASEMAEALKKGKEVFDKLANKYHVPIGKVVTQQGPTVLAAILVKVDEGELLDSDELRRLEAADCANVAATYFYRQYRLSSDPWQLVKACSSLRRAGQPAKALKISATTSGPLITDSKAHGALLTTRGGAYRDTNELDQAKKCAHQAISLAPESFHPHNLMGAILYEEGEIQNGDQHFQMALERGSNARVQDSEIRHVLTKTTPENRRAIVEYLINKDANRYGWAKAFAA